MIPHYQDHRLHINQLIMAALAAADPAAAVKQKLVKKGKLLQVGSDTFELNDGQVFIIGIGKASVTMGFAAAEILGDSLAQGVLITKGDNEKARVGLNERTNLPSGIQIFEAGHPVSDERGVNATAVAIELAKKATADDLVLCLISGGASALFTHPRIQLNDWQRLVDALLGSGCTINELNSVRKQLDEVKGGGLARLAAPATCLSLILSDVVGNPLDVIGSGPTVPNPDDPATAYQVLNRYNIETRLSAEIWHRVVEQLRSIDSDDSIEKLIVFNYVIGDVRQAAEAAVRKAIELGFDAKLLTAYLEGEAREVGRVVAALAKDALAGSCLVLGGETTVTLQGKGLGGRNQELALAAALAMSDWQHVALASFASDGDDGPTDAAGAIVTGETVPIAVAAGLDPLSYLDQNDSYHFFQAVNGLIKTGPTGTNVNDLVFILKYES